MNDFDEQLEWSRKASDWSGWHDLYQALFPRLSVMVDHPRDGWQQRAGIDRSLILDDSKQFLIDEKARGKNRITGVVYEDIALEYLSNDRTGALGWVCKPLSADFIAYAILPLGRAYLLPVPQLQLAWERNGKAWRARHGERSARNRGYNTLFCPVPVPVLFSAMGATLRHSFAPFRCTDDDA